MRRSKGVVQQVSMSNQRGEGRYHENGKFLLKGYYYGLLRFITEFYYGYYVTFLKDFIDSEPRPQISTRNSNIRRKKPGKELIYYGYYGILRILRKSLLRNITEYNDP